MSRCFLQLRMFVDRKVVSSLSAAWDSMVEEVEGIGTTLLAEGQLLQKRGQHIMQALQAASHDYSADLDRKGSRD